MSITTKLGRLGAVVGMALHFGAGPVAGQSGVGVLPPPDGEGEVAYLFKQCDEDAVGILLDPAPFRELVEPDFELLLDEGMARVALIVQDCSQYWVDGENLGSDQHANVWVEIEGAGDVRPVVGAERTMPTRTWFSVFHGSTNARGREARMASKTAPEPIEGVALDPPGAERGGRVSVSDGMSYSWRVTSVEPPFRLLGVNHDVYVRTAEGEIVFKRIQAIGNQVAGPHPGTLEVVRSTDPSGLVPAGTYPGLVFTFFPLWARVTAGDAPPEGWRRGGGR